MNQNLDMLEKLFDIGDSFDANLKKNFLYSVIPGVLGLGGAVLFKFGFLPTVILNQAGLWLGLFNTTMPLLKGSNQK